VVLIVVLCPQLHGVHGIARYVQSFLKHLPPHASDVTVLTGEPPTAEHAWAGRMGVRLENLPMPEGRWGLWIWSWHAMRRLKQMLRRWPIQVVMLHTPPLIPAWVFMRGLGRELPWVLTVHTTDLGMSGRLDQPRRYPSPYGLLSLALRLRIEGQLFRAATRVITLTPQGVQELAHYGRTQGVRVIPNGADLQRFHPLDFEAAMRTQSGLLSRIDVLFAGRLEPRKGSLSLVRACRALLALRPDLRIVVAGPGPDEALVRASLQGLGPGLEVLGTVRMADMPSLYRRSRVLVSTSYYEGLPGTCLEAMACGVPPVVWRLPFYEGLVDDGVTGCTVPVDDMAQLAHAVIGLLDQPRVAQRMGQAAAERVLSRHDWSRLAQDILKVCQEADRSVTAAPPSAHAHTSAQVRP